MKIVYSYLNYSKDFGTFINEKIIYMSLEYIKRHGYETVLYVDEKNYDRLKNFKFDNFVVFDEKEINSLPYGVWCLGKVLAYSKVKEPFCHLDFDLFMVKDVLKKLRREKIFCLHYEPWRKIEKYNPYIKTLEEKIPLFSNSIKNIDRDNVTYNCGLIGGRAIKEINYCSNLVLDFCKKIKL